MGSGNSLAPGCCVELAVTASSEHPSPGERHLCSAPPPALGMSCGWAPQRASPRPYSSPAIPCPHLPVRRGGTRVPLCKKSFLPEPGTLGSNHRRRVLSGPGARGLGGVERGQVGKPDSPLPSRSPPLPPATRSAAASSVPLALRGAVPVQLRARGEGAERWRAFPTQPLSCCFHSNSFSRRLHPARSSQS